MKATKSPRANYKHVCTYCGVAYESNRSTSKFCSDRHRSLYHAGKDKAPKKKRGKELVDDYNAILQRVYDDRKDGNKDNWSRGLPASMLRRHFNYAGPLPSADEIIITSGFAIRRRTWVKPEAGHEGIYSYTIKPAQLLTTKELLDNAK